MCNVQNDHIVHFNILCNVYCHLFQNGVSPIIAASVNGSVEVIPVLQKAGANVNSKDNVTTYRAIVNDVFNFVSEVRTCYNVHTLFVQSGRTPLHAACTEGHYDVVETLVNLNASQSSQDKVGWSYMII